MLSGDCRPASTAKRAKTKSTTAPPTYQPAPSNHLRTLASTSLSMLRPARQRPVPSRAWTPGPHRQAGVPSTALQRRSTPARRYGRRGLRDGPESRLRRQREGSRACRVLPGSGWCGRRRRSAWPRWHAHRLDRRVWSLPAGAAGPGQGVQHRPPAPIGQGPQNSFHGLNVPSWLRNYQGTQADATWSGSERLNPDREPAREPHQPATVSARDSQQHRAAADVDLGDRVDGVVIDRYEPVVRTGQLRCVAEAVGGRWRERPHALASKAADLLQVEDQRETVDVGLGSQRRQIITHHKPPGSAATTTTLASHRRLGITPATNEARPAAWGVTGRPK